MIVRYYLPDNGLTPGDARELDKDYIGFTLAQLAEIAAQHHHDHDGWESFWPQTIVLLNAQDEELGEFEVEREMIPQFHASEVK